MAKSVNQKGKILYLEKILLATDEKHTCSMQDILSQLMECGIKAERKSIYDDMEVLRGFGMDTVSGEESGGILSCRRKYQKSREGTSDGIFCK